MTFERVECVEIWDIMKNTGEEILIGYLLKRDADPAFSFYPTDIVSLEVPDLMEISLKLQQFNDNAPTP